MAKKLPSLYKELGIESADDLEEACRTHKIQSLAGFGKKTEDNILAALANAGGRPDRLPLSYMLPIAERMEEVLSKMEYVLKFSRAGSLRRMRETIKDLDFIIATENPLEVKEQLLKLDHVKEVIAAGDTKVSIVLNLDYDVSVDFRLVQSSEFATTLHHFTGSKDHNVRMRQLAKARGEKISEYGVEKSETGEVITFSSEAEFYAHFDLPLIPPEMREDGREVEEYKDEYGLISLSRYKRGSPHAYHVE